jgi:hypothetical protein
MKVIDPGHIYDLTQLGGGVQRISFVKRSGGAITYEAEWSGVQSQEVIRMLIDRTKYLRDILSSVETEDAIYHLRMALFMYEVRAYRRKQEGVNRREPSHDDSERPRPWRARPFEDIPFDEFEIELRPIGPDGHIVL